MNIIIKNNISNEQQAGKAHALKVCNKSIQDELSHTTEGSQIIGSNPMLFTIQATRPGITGRCGVK
jgi:hypothetical protein